MQNTTPQPSYPKKKKKGYLTYSIFLLNGTCHKMEEPSIITIDQLFPLVLQHHQHDLKVDKPITESESQLFYLWELKKESKQSTQNKKLETRILQPHEVASTIFGDLFAESVMLLKMRQPIQDLVVGNINQYSPACVDLLFVEASWVVLQEDAIIERSVLVTLASLYLFICCPSISAEGLEKVIMENAKNIIPVGQDIAQFLQEISVSYSVISAAGSTREEAKIQYVNLFMNTVHPNVNMANNIATLDNEQNKQVGSIVEQITSLLDNLSLESLKTLQQQITKRIEAEESKNTATVKTENKHLSNDILQKSGPILQVLTEEQQQLFLLRTYQWAFSQDLGNILRKTVQFLSEITSGNMDESYVVSASNDIRSLLASDNYSLINFLSGAISTETASSRRSDLMKVIATLADIDPRVWQSLADTQPFNWIIKLLTIPDDDTVMSVVTYLALLCVKTVLPPLEMRKLDADLVEHLLGLAINHLYDTEDTLFVAILKCLMCIGSKFGSELKENPLLAVFSSNKSQAANLGNYIILLLNRPDDIMLFPCLKLIYDLFSNPSTVDFFFQNDLIALIDILIREIKNLPVEQDQKRSEYVKVLYAILKNSTEYGRVQHKLSEVIFIVKTCMDLYSSGPTFEMVEKIVLETPYIK